MTPSFLLSNSRILAASGGATSLLASCKELAAYGGKFIKINQIIIAHRL